MSNSELNSFIIMPLLICGISGRICKTSIYDEEELYEHNICRLVYQLRIANIAKVEDIKFCTCEKNTKIYKTFLEYVGEKL